MQLVSAAVHSKYVHSKAIKAILKLSFNIFKTNYV